MQRPRLPRAWPPFVLLFCLAALVLGAGPIAATARAEGAIGLADLDLSQVQDDRGVVVDGQLLRTDAGVVLRPGTNLWVDLRGSALQLRATVAPLPGSRGGTVRCRFATANDVRQVVLRAGDPPASIDLPLQGQTLLTIESQPIEGNDGISIHLTSSSLRFENARPESWGGAGPIDFKTPEWNVRMDGRSGGLTHLSSPRDPAGMEWIRQAAPWGTGWARVGAQNFAWDRPIQVRQTAPTAAEALYRLPQARVRVRRSIDAEKRLVESYTFENTSGEPLEFAEGTLGIRVPLVDSYPGADVCLTQRCHVHLWTGGSTAYVNALRMGGAAPHLGLVVTEGALSAYSIYDRIQHSNDRGQFVLHPAAMVIPPHQSRTVRWVLFWHEGADDFAAKAAAVDPFVQLEAEHYTVELGGVLRVRAHAKAPLEGARLLLNGEPVPATVSGMELRAEIPMGALGEQVVSLEQGERRTLLRAYVTLPPLELIRNRVRFIVEHQQRHQPGDPLDGAFLLYDNETGQPVHDPGFSDHNAGRERLAMGVLGALYWPHCDDPALRGQLASALRAYDAFVNRELQDESGRVYNGVKRAGPERLYNYPWVIQFHLAMYDAFGRPEHLRRALDAARAYYNRGGERFYCIGMPVTGLLRALEQAGWSNERKEMLARFAKHGATLAAFGRNYPKHEVNYEQSIVGPAAQLLLELHRATGDAGLLRAAEEQLQLLELFNGRQPDYHLHDIAIRHWDDFWFGKRRLYGDTFPHYWSTITGVVFTLYGQATGRTEYETRGRDLLANNLSAFTPDGRASCAYVYPLTVNGQPGRFSDPWANDQDWALVAWLQCFAPVAGEAKTHK